MKIDPVTYEVDMSAGTHPLYVWEAPVRVWHWAMMVCMFVMIVTGFLIGAPLVSNLGDTWATYDFAYIRFAHFAAGIIYTVLFIYRLYWAVVGNKYSRQIFIPPLWSWKWWKGVFGQVAYYLFMKKTSAEYAGHNPGSRSSPCSASSCWAASSSSSRVLRFMLRPGVPTRAGWPGSDGCSRSLAMLRPCVRCTMH